MDKLAEDERLLVGGFDAGRINRARQVIQIEGKVTDCVRGDGRSDRTGRMDALRDAKEDLASGYQSLKTGYFGVKNYACFGDQRTDCEYGMGPRHGSIVFSIGFTRDIRDKVREGYKLTPQEVEDALYLLSVLPKIETHDQIQSGLR